MCLPTPVLKPFARLTSTWLESWHPDRFQSDERLRKVAGEHLREVNDAYAILKTRRPPEKQRPQPEQSSTGPRSTSSQGRATVAEDPPSARPDSGRPPAGSPSWPPSPALRHNSSLTLVSRFISNNGGACRSGDCGLGSAVHGGVSISEPATCSEPEHHLDFALPAQNPQSHANYRSAQRGCRGSGDYGQLGKRGWHRSLETGASERP